MVKENPYYIKENTVKVEEVKYLNTEIPSYAEFVKTWQRDKVSDSYDSEINAYGELGKGYGPCGKDGCKCSCNWKSGCSCRLLEYEMVGDKRGDWEAIVGKGSIQGKIGWDGVELGIEDSKSIFRKKDSYEETNCWSALAGGRVNLGTDGNVSAKGKLGFDVVNYENTDGFQARLGVNLETGGSIGEDGIEAKFLGVGFSLGKKNGISFGIGEISNKDDDNNCVVQ